MDQVRPPRLIIIGPRTLTEVADASGFTTGLKPLGYLKPEDQLLNDGPYFLHSDP
jgi:hypothetical protein